MKILTPTIIDNNGNYEIKFIIMSENRIDAYISSCLYQDNLGNILEFTYLDGLKTINKKSFLSCFHTIRDRLHYANSKIKVQIADNTNKEVYVLEYKIDISKRISLVSNNIRTFDKTDFDFADDMEAVSGVQFQYDENSYESADPFIQKYKNLLFSEMYYLQEHGGRKYRITNGTIISAQPGEYAYVFEMETELHISDASPAKLILSDGIEAVGEVLECDEFDITLIMKSYCGEFISSAYLTVEPWKLMKTLANRFVHFNTAIHHIEALLINEGPRLADNSKQICEIAMGQEKAIRYVSDNPITIVWGPPGTGKSYTMAKIAIDAMFQNKKVLIVSHSNVSVDGVILKVIDQLIGQNKSEPIKNGKVIRYGFIKDEQLRNNDNVSSFNRAISMIDGFKEKKLELDKRIEYLNKLGQKNTQKMISAKKELQKLHVATKEKEREIVLGASILSTTISKVVMDKVFYNNDFDIVMFDEVSMASIPQVCIAAMHAKQKLICVGDFCQLAPIAQSTKKAELERDIFEYLGISGVNRQPVYHPWLVMLNVQRRMHPMIADFVSRTVYHNLLKTHPDNISKLQTILKKEPFVDSPIVNIDLKTTYCPSWKDSNNSRFNLLNAFVSVTVAIVAAKEGASVAIITPYAAQTRLINAILLDLRQGKNIDIVCSTIHQFQGSERDVVILDAVESYPSPKMGWLLSKNENQQVTRLINVAVTRARAKLITISDSRFFINKLKGTNHELYKLFEYIGVKGITLSKIDLYSFLQKNQNGKILQFNNDLSDFLTDLTESKKDIIMSIPSGLINDDETSSFKNIYENYLNKHMISIRAKTKDFENMIPFWKQLSEGCDNAIFPLCIIDNEKLWYERPTALTEFVDGRKGFKTINHFYIRYTGKKAIEIIKILTDIEYVGNSFSRRPLDSKMTSLRKDDLPDFATFVSDEGKCLKCGGKVVMKHGKKSFYLQCINKSCNGMEYINTSFIDQYITKYNVDCPYCGSVLRGRMGPFGPYIICKNNEERHIIKLNEI